MRTRTTFAALAVAIAPFLAPPAAGAAQDSAPVGQAAGGKTFRAILFLVPGEADGEGLRVERLREVWGEGDSAAKLQARLNGIAPQQLQVLTVSPGQDEAVVRYKDLTFRIGGLYRGPQKDRMYLKVSFDAAGQAAVKEFLAGFDESVIVAYPLAGGNESLLALLVPVN